jgi:FkbM family methyltransferase
MLKRLTRQCFEAFGLSIQRSRPRSLEVQAELFPDARVIFDVGAHVGETAREYRTLFPLADIYSFEPFPRSFAVLQRSMSGDPRFHPQRIALLDTAGEYEMRCNRSDDTNSVLSTAPQGQLYWGDIVDTIETVPIAAMTLDNFCETNGIQHIDILKLDTQGTEMRVLRGALSTLSQRRVAAVYSEVLVAPTYTDQCTFDEMMRFLREAGYYLRDIQNLSHLQGALRQFDALFVRAL